MGVFKMPSLGADMEAGKLVEWLIKPGDTVARGDIVAVVETQKGAIEIECFETGTVHELLADLETELPVGAPLAVLLAEGEAPPESPGSAPEPASRAAAAPEPEPVAPPVAPRPAAPGTQIMASPAARVRAAERGVDLGSLRGSGPGGVIVLQDVEGAGPDKAQSRTPAGTPAEEMRKAIAAAMTRSKQTIPHFYLSQTLDIQPAMDFLADRNAGRQPADRVLLGALYLRAMTRAADEVAGMNGHYADGAFQPSDTVNPAVAVALRGGGLVAPAIMDALTLDLDQIMAAMRDLVTRARAGRLRSSEMTAGTITLSSLGESGAEEMTGVIFPPQVALLAIGAPQRRPWLVGEDIVPRRVVTATLSADHRVSDGRQAARFLSCFETLIQSPEDL